MPQPSLTFVDNETGNTALAAALLSVGIDPYPAKPYRKYIGDVRGGERYVWKFQPVSKCGKFNTQELIKAWEDKTWHERHPDHPFAYMKCQTQNKDRLLDMMKRKVPLAAIDRGGKTALISLDASPDLQDRIFAKLEQR